MSLLPTTPGFLHRGLQALTGLFRKSEPSLNVIQRRAEVNKVRIDIFNIDIKLIIND